MKDHQQDQDIPQYRQGTHRILLLCDFTGKIVFWKGNSKVLQTLPDDLLGMNFFNLRFTYHSRLTLHANLSTEIFEQGKIKQFDAEIVRESALGTQVSIQRAQAFSFKRQQRYFHQNLKILKIFGSCIYTQFGQKSEISLNGVKVELIPQSKSLQASEGILYEEEEFFQSENPQVQQQPIVLGDMDKILMLEIEQKYPDEMVKDNQEFFYKIKYHTDIIDLQYVKRLPKNYDYINEGDQQQGNIQMQDYSQELADFSRSQEGEQEEDDNSKGKEAKNNGKSQIREQNHLNHQDDEIIQFESSQMQKEGEKQQLFHVREDEQRKQEEEILKTPSAKKSRRRNAAMLESQKKYGSWKSDQGSINKFLNFQTPQKQSHLKFQESEQSQMRDQEYEWQDQKE